jgi:cell wall-associated NlpC family hydrolase
MATISGAAQSSQTARSEARKLAAQAVVDLGSAFEQTTLDCSHFVNYLFTEVGLDYDYEPSSILYEGTEAFRRVYHPIAGDLIVWRGHVGVIVDPEAKTFLSALRHGVKTSSYVSSYWRRRGIPRFLRYKLPIDSYRVWEARNGGMTRTFSDSGMN